VNTHIWGPDSLESELAPLRLAQMSLISLIPAFPKNSEHSEEGYDSGVSCNPCGHVAYDSRTMSRPLATRDHKRFTRSRKTTLWDTNPGSQFYWRGNWRSVG
jgi:hypothetical protein